MTARDSAPFDNCSLDSSFRTGLLNEKLIVRRTRKSNCLFQRPRRAICSLASASGFLAPHSFASRKQKAQFRGPIAVGLPGISSHLAGELAFFSDESLLASRPSSAYNSEILTIDGNTGTQLDFPPHSSLLPTRNCPNAGPLGLTFSETTPAWQFVGEACVIDATQFLDKGPNGRSSLIPKETGRPMGEETPAAGIRRRRSLSKRLLPTSTTCHFQPEGDFWQSLSRTRVQAGRIPSLRTMDYLGSRGVKSAGTDSPSMGPIPDLAEPTHYAGLKHGMIWAESVTGLGGLPSTGAFYCVLAPKHAGGATSESRAFAIVEACWQRS